MLTFAYFDMKMIYGIFFMIAVCGVKVRTELSEDSVETRGILRDLLKNIISEVNADTTTTTSAGFFNIFDFGGSDNSSTSTTDDETTTVSSGIFDFLSGFDDPKSSSTTTTTSTTATSTTTNSTGDQSTTSISGMSTLFSGYRRLTSTESGWLLFNWIGHGRRRRPFPKLNIKKLPAVGTVQGTPSRADNSTGSTRNTKPLSFIQVDARIHLKAQDTVIGQPLHKTGTAISNVEDMPSVKLVNDEDANNIVANQQQTDHGRPSPYVKLQNEASVDKALRTDAATKTKSTTEHPPTDNPSPQNKLPISQVANTTNNLTSEASDAVSANDEVQVRNIFGAVVESLIDVLNKSITPASSTVTTSTTEPPNTFIRADGSRVPYPGDDVTADDSYTNTTPKPPCNDGFVTKLLKQSAALVPSFIRYLFDGIPQSANACDDQTAAPKM